MQQAPPVGPRSQHGRKITCLVVALACAAIVMMFVDSSPPTTTELESFVGDPDPAIFMETTATSKEKIKRSNMDSRKAWAAAAYEAKTASKEAKKMRHKIKKQLKKDQANKEEKTINAAQNARKSHKERQALRHKAAKATASKLKHGLQGVLRGSSELAAKAAVNSAKEAIQKDKEKHHAIEVAGKAEAKKKMKLQFLVDRLKAIRGQIRQVQLDEKRSEILAKKNAQLYAAKVERKVGRIKKKFMTLQARLTTYHRLLKRIAGERKAIEALEKRIYTLRQQTHNATVKLGQLKDQEHKERCRKREHSRKMARQRTRVRRKYDRKMERVRKSYRREQRRKLRPEVNGVNILHRASVRIVVNRRSIKERTSKIKKLETALKKTFSENEKLNKLDKRRRKVLLVAQKAYTVMEKAEERLVKVVNSKPKGGVKSTKGNGLSFMKKLVKTVGNKMKGAVKVGQKMQRPHITKTLRTGVPDTDRIKATLRKGFKQFRKQLNTMTTKRMEIKTQSAKTAKNQVSATLPHRAQTTAKTPSSQGSYKKWFVYQTGGSRLPIKIMKPISKAKLKKIKEKARQGKKHLLSYLKKNAIKVTKVAKKLLHSADKAAGKVTGKKTGKAVATKPKKAGKTPPARKAPKKASAKKKAAKKKAAKQAPKKQKATKKKVVKAASKTASKKAKLVPKKKTGSAKKKGAAKKKVAKKVAKKKAAMKKTAKPAAAKKKAAKKKAKKKAAKKKAAKKAAKKKAKKKAAKKKAKTKALAKAKKKKALAKAKTKALAKARKKKALAKAKTKALAKAKKKLAKIALPATADTMRPEKNKRFSKIVSSVRSAEKKVLLNTNEVAVSSKTVKAAAKSNHMVKWWDPGHWKKARSTKKSKSLKGTAKAIRN